MFFLKLNQLPYSARPQHCFIWPWDVQNRWVPTFQQNPYLTRGENPKTAKKTPTLCQNSLYHPPPPRSNAHVQSWQEFQKYSLETMCTHHAHHSQCTHKTSSPVVNVVHSVCTVQLFNPRLNQRAGRKGSKQLHCSNASCVQPACWRWFWLLTAHREPIAGDGPCRGCSAQ